MLWPGFQSIELRPQLFLVTYLFLSELIPQSACERKWSLHCSLPYDHFSGQCVVRHSSACEERVLTSSLLPRSAIVCQASQKPHIDEMLTAQV